MKKTRCSLLAYWAIITVACASAEREGSKPRAEAESAGEQYFVRLIAPEGDGAVSGEAKLGVDYSIEGSVERVEVGFENEEPAVFDQITPTLTFDTTTLLNGTATLVLRVVNDLGNEYSDSLSLSIDNPKHRFLGYESPRIVHAKGETLELDLEYSEAHLDIAADLSGLDSEFRSGKVSVSEGDDGHYVLQYPISSENEKPDGTYPVELVASDPAGEALVSTIWIQYRGAPPLPLAVPGALHTDRSGIRAHVVAEAAPGVSSLTGPRRIVSGQKEVLNVTLTDSPERPARYLTVQAVGYSGGYLLPVTGPEVQVPLELAPMAASTDLGEMTLLVGAIDDTGSTLGFESYQIQPIPVPVGGVQVLLTWNAAVDLDLEVVTPAGNTIGYTNPEADGGRLLLDSNSMCQIDGINAETVSWPIGQERSGSYFVRANLYDMCGTDSVDYTVQVVACGEEQTFIGTFSQADYDAGALVHDVGSFDVDCAHHVGGRVTFDTTSPGVPSEAPAVEIPIQALDSDRHVIASTRTDQYGNYFMALSPPPIGPYTIVAMARWDVPGGPNWGLRVLPHTGDTEYSWESNPLDIASDAAHVEDIHITEQNFSGALNILEFMRQGRQWMIAEGLVPRAPLIARWERWNPTPFGGAVACAPSIPGCNGEWALHYSGVVLDYGAFDPSVLQHEFGHHLIYSLSRNGNGGGAHGWAERVRATLAWDEGIATALGQDMLGSPVYRDRTVNSAGTPFAFEIDIENGPSAGHPVEAVARGTASPNNEISGDMCELIPAMVVWDLFDPATPVGAASDSYDWLGDGRRPALDALFWSLPQPSWVGRGAAGVDLADFLDAWFCNDSVGRDAAAQAERAGVVGGILLERAINYDFAWTSQCAE